MWWLCLLNDDIHKRMTNIQHTEWEKHMVRISTVKPPIGSLNDAFRKCFYNGLHMTLECTNTKQFGLFLSGCITMSLSWRTEPTETLAHQSSKQAEFCKVLNSKKKSLRKFQTEKPKKIPNRETQENSKQTNKTKTENKKPNQEKQNDLLTWVSAHLVRPSWWMRASTWYTFSLKGVQLARRNLALKRRVSRGVRRGKSMSSCMT